MAAAEKVAAWLRGERTHVYVNSDVAGVQLGGAIKNVIAILPAPTISRAIADSASASVRAASSTK